jgi:hypothetical protein
VSQKKVTECLVQLSDWDTIEDWLEQVRELRTKYSSNSTKSPFNLRREENYLAALIKYDLGEREAAKEYVHITLSQQVT